MDAETIANLGTQLVDLKRVAELFSADAHFYSWQENEITIRGDEVCAAIQRLEWALNRMQPTAPKASAAVALGATSDLKFVASNKT